MQTQNGMYALRVVGEIHDRLDLLDRSVARRGYCSGAIPIALSNLGERPPHLPVPAEEARNNAAV